MRSLKLGRGRLSATVLVTALATALLGFPSAVAASAPSGGCATASGITTCTFDYTGAVESWTVPAGVTEVTIDAYGAAGGTAAGGSITGGKGAHVHATVPVTGGDALDVTVGGRGLNYPNGPTNAFGGGGLSYYGGGGGGGSFVYDGASALAIAGGGGGGGEQVLVSGGVGGDSGSPGGTAADDGTAVGSTGGGAGTSSAGGTGGQEYDCGTLYAAGAGGDGSLGQGGVGGSYGTHDPGVTTGGGGGGGYYGGGGGGNFGNCIAYNSGGGGGGGGSSYTDPSASDVSVTDGIQGGNGLVTISYELHSAPSGADNTITMTEGASYSFSAADFPFSDADGDGLAAVKISSLPAAGALTDDSLAVTAGEFVGAADIGAGKLVFSPTTGASGTPYTSFTFQVEDDGGTANGGADLDPSANTLTIDVVALTPYARKQAAATSLQALRPWPWKPADRRLKKAIQRIDNSLKSWRWDGADALDPRWGWKVFKNERTTVVWLSSPLFAGNGTVDDAITTLVAADRQIVVNAIAGSSDSAAIARANQLVAKADDLATNGKNGKAIYVLFRAWRRLN